MKHAFTALLALTALIALTGSAQAFDECESDADCIDGFVCEDIGGVTCVDIDCPPGEECPEPPPCEDETWNVCVPGPCRSDADCAEGLSCLEVVFEECDAVPVPSCEPGEECPDPPEPDGECETITEAYCLPPWAAPCEADADCGEGFTCVEAEMCECSGGGEVPPHPGDPDPDPEPEPLPEDDCTCAPTGERYCEPVESLCEDATDCPEGWTCEEGPTATPCYWDEETGEEVCDDPIEADGYCMPPYFEFGFSGGGAGEDEGGIDLATGGENSRVTGPNSEPLADDILDEHMRDTRPRDGSGCTVAPGAPSAAGALMVLLPLLLGRLRRR